MEGLVGDGGIVYGIDVSGYNSGAFVACAVRLRDPRDRWCYAKAMAALTVRLGTA